MTSTKQLIKIDKLNVNIEEEMKRINVKVNDKHTHFLVFFYRLKNVYPFCKDIHPLLIRLWDNPEDITYQEAFSTGMLEHVICFLISWRYYDRIINEFDKCGTNWYMVLMFIIYWESLINEEMRMTEWLLDNFIVDTGYLSQELKRKYPNQVIALEPQNNDLKLCLAVGTCDIDYIKPYLEKKQYRIDLAKKWLVRAYQCDKLKELGQAICNNNYDKLNMYSMEMLIQSSGNYEFINTWKLLNE